MGMPLTPQSRLLPACIAASLIASAPASAAPTNFTSSFTMYTPVGSLAGPIDATVTGTFDLTTKTFSLNSTTPFFGFLWSTHDGTLYTPGTYVIDTTDAPGNTCNPAFSICAGDGSALGGTGQNVTFVVPAGMVGGHIKFAWNVTDGIDVFMLWDSSGTSVDFGTSSPSVSPDGIPGYKMIDGPFIGYSANFDTTPPITSLADTSVPTTVPTSEPGTSYGAGALASAVGSSDGSGLTASDVGSDEDMEQQCVGGCFDFTVTGVTPGNSAKVVLLLSESIPAKDAYHQNITYRKKINGVWQDFVVDTNNKIGSASPTSTSPLTCPGPGSFSYSQDLNAGDQCIQLTIVDGGPNDADGLANGTISDPGGIGVGNPVTSNIADPSFGGGGCSLGSGTATERGDWWLLALVLGGFGIWRRKRA